MNKMSARNQLQSLTARVASSQRFKRSKFLKPLARRILAFEKSLFLSLRYLPFVVANRQEGLFLSILYLRYIVLNPTAREILAKPPESMAQFAGECASPSMRKPEQNNWWRQMFLRYALAMHYSKGANVVDTCSGLGWGAYLLSDVANTVTAVDINMDAIKLARELWGQSKAQYINGSVLQIPISDETCDVVTAMESIEHFNLDDGEKYLNEIYRILKPNGLLLGSCPLFPETETEAVAICAECEWHLHIYTKSELSMLLKRLCYEQVKIFRNRLFFAARK
jgi:ubiquinone/menaquinone biosynthesis C-methylase UbiE